MTQNLWDRVKAVLRSKFIAIQSYLKKQEKSQINNQAIHLNQTGKEQKKSYQKERIHKIRAEISEIEMKKTIEKINKTKTLFFEKKIKLINLQPDSKRKKKKERIRINKIRNEKEEITTDITEIQRSFKRLQQKLPRWSSG